VYIFGGANRSRPPPPPIVAPLLGIIIIRFFGITVSFVLTCILILMYGGKNKSGLTINIDLYNKIFIIIYINSRP